MSPLTLPRIPLPRAFRPALPALAVAVAERSIAVARVSQAGGRAAVAGFLAALLPEGAVTCSAVQPNIGDPEPLRAHLRAARPRVAPSGGPISLCVPDPVARVTILSLDAVPRRAPEIQELVSWRLKKQIPYKIDEAQVGWDVLGARAAGTAVLAAAVRRRVLAEYEDLLAAEGFHVGLVTTATLALAQALPPSDHDVLLINASDSWFTLLATDGTAPLLIRTKHLPSSDQDGDARHAAIAAEIPPTLEFLGRKMNRTGSTRLVVHDARGQAGALADRLAAATAQPASPLPEVVANLPPEMAARLLPAAVLAARGLGLATSLGGAA